MIENIGIVGFILFIFGFAGTMFFDDPQSRESKLSQFAFVVGVILIAITFIGTTV